jgi:ribosomal protein S18 acetylase RimI-like enzyme
MQPELNFRPARLEEDTRLRELILESFEPITWYKKVELQFGPLHGHGWRDRWRLRLDKVFATQEILVGEEAAEIVAVATGTFEEETRLGFIDLLAVDRRRQGSGYGRAMLRGMLDYLKARGAEHAHLECLTDNDRGNALYRSEGWSLISSSHHWFVKL